MIELPRRHFIAGLGALFAAPAIVRASSLMPVKAFVDDGIYARYFVPAAPPILELGQILLKGNINQGEWMRLIYTGTAQWAVLDHSKSA